LRAAVLFTGGKDSTYALHLAYFQGYEIEVLVSIVPTYRYSMMYHKPIPRILELQSTALGIPLELVEVKDPSMEVDVLRNILSRVIDEYSVDTIVSGTLSSLYQKTIIDMVSNELGLRHYTPLWLTDQYRYMVELVDNGVVFMLMSVSTHGLGRDYLCKPIGRLELEDILKKSRIYGFNPAFEGGEAETIVLNAPLFRKRVFVEGYVESMGLDEHYCIVKNAYLVDASS